jgi:hypothetical protein
MKLLYLVALASSACLDEVQHSPVHAGNEEVRSESVKSFLCAFVTDTMRALQDVPDDWGGRRDIDFAMHGYQLICEPPLLATAPSTTLSHKARSSGFPASSARSSSKSVNEGNDSAINSPASAMSQRDRAFTTVFFAPGLYSTLKSKPSSLLAH